MSEVLNIENLVYGSCVKIERLIPLISTSYRNSDCTNINIFIDLNSVFKQMYTNDGQTFKTSNSINITAAVINMCGHYRSFFRRLGVESTIYLIYGLNTPESNDKFVTGYNSKFISSYIMKPMVTNMIEENLKMIKLLCQYIPDVYFFDIGRCEVSSMVAYIIKYTNPKAQGKENIVISKDILMLQLVPEYDIRVIRPVKTKLGDESYIIDRSNLWKSFIHLYRKCKDPEIDLGVNLISNVLAMTRVPERSMPSIFSIPAITKILSTALNNNFISRDIIYNQVSINNILSALDIPHNPVELEMRYKAINTEFQSSYILLRENPNLKTLRFIDLRDPVGLKEIVTKYFNTPIDLERL